MKLLFCKNNIKECLDYVNKHNPALESPINEEELLQAARDILINFKDPVYKGITLQFIDTEGGIMLVCWVLPTYETPQYSDIEEFDLEITEEEIISNIFDKVIELTGNKDEIDSDPRITHFNTGGKLN